MHAGVKHKEEAANTKTIGDYLVAKACAVHNPDIPAPTTTQS